MFILALLVAVIILIFALDRLIEHMYRYDKTIDPATPADQQFEFEELSIPTKKAGQLHGWWIPFSAEAPTLILIHGWGQSAARMLPYIRHIQPNGYNLLIFSARNHGRSSSFKYPTIHTFTEDALAVIDFITRSDLTTNPQIGLVGLSVGGGAAINAAAANPHIQSVITIGAVSHPVDVMNAEFKKRRVPKFIAKFLLFFMRTRFRINFDKIAPINNIPHVKADIFLIHGSEDKVIPLQQGQALAAAGNPAKTRLWVVSGKGHSNCATHPQFWEKTAAFLQAS